MENLKTLIKKGNFDWVNDNITKEHFPLGEIRGKVKIFHFNRSISSEDAIKEMAKEGYEPANIYELLEYAEKDWNGTDCVVALGSVWRGLDDRYVACLWGVSRGRDLRLDWFGLGWGARCRFAAVRKSLEAKELGSSLETRVLALEEDMKKIKDLFK